MLRKIVFGLAVVIVTSMLGMQARAQEWSSGGWQAAPGASSEAASGRLVHLNGTLKGTVAITDGACTQGFSAQCPTGHVCECFTAMGAKFSSSGIGKGSANLFATVDTSATFGPLGEDCVPLYAEFDVIAKKDSPNFDVIGGACFNPQGNIVSNGTMGLASSNLFTPTGYLAYTATINPNASGSSGRLTLKFSGAAQ
jgi:hypothetical protein